MSVPTVARMVQKLGYKGYPDFQAELREELRAKAKNPIAKHDTWAEAAPLEHMLNRFTDAVIDNIRLTLGQIDPAAFDQACALVTDQTRHLYIVGGRITHTLAEYLFMHMQVIRAHVTQVQSTSNSWPHSLLNAKEGDVFVIFDVAEISLSCRIIVPSAWDSAATTLLLVETMIAAAQNLNWDETKDRMETLEDMFDQTKLFRKFT